MNKKIIEWKITILHKILQNTKLRIYQETYKTNKHIKDK